MSSSKCFLSQNKIIKQKLWFKHTKSNKFPVDIPIYPNEKYKEWTNWGSFLQTGNIGNRYKKFRSFESAKKFVKRLNIKSFEKWRIFNKSKDFPNDIPRNPNLIYSKKWKSWPDFFGKSTKTRNRKS